MELPAMPEEEMPLTAAPGPAGCQLFGYVGIEAVLDQMKIKTMKTGFEFNIMVVGECQVRGLLPVNWMNWRYPNLRDAPRGPGGINLLGGTNRSRRHPAGQSGLGKSTMVNTLFKSKVSRKASQPGQEERIPKTVQLQSVTHGKVTTMTWCPTNPGEKQGTGAGV